MAEIILPPEEETPQVPELNIDKPTDNSKVITIEFEAKKTNKVSTKDTNQQLYTTDTDAWFEFKETSLEGANGTYSVVFRNRHDGSIFQRTGDVVNGVGYYKIPHQEIRHAGAWRGQIVYTLSNGDTTAREFGYDVQGHILDGKDVREIVVEDFETLMSQLRSMKDSAEVELVNLTQELRSINDTAEQNETDRQAFFDDLVEDIGELQANYQELLDTGVLQTNINTKLEQLEEEYAPKLTEVTAQLADKADQSFVDSQFSSIVSGAPKGTYTNLTALQTAYPNGADGVFLVLENGHWYYWNGATNNWTSGGVYQSSGLADGSVTPSKLAYKELDFRYEEVESIFGENYWTETGIVKQFGTALLDGSALSSMSKGTNVDVLRFSADNFPNRAYWPNFNEGNTLILDRFNLGETVEPWDVADKVGYHFKTPTEFRIIVEKGRFPSVNEAITYLNSNPIKVFYKIVSEEFLPFPNNLSQNTKELIKTRIAEPDPIPNDSITPDMLLQKELDSTYEELELPLGRRYLSNEGLIAEFGIAVLRGTSVRSMSSGVNVDAISFHGDNFPNRAYWPNFNEGNTLILDRFNLGETNVEAWDNIENIGKHGKLNTGVFWIYVEKERFSDINDAKQYFDNNPLTVYYLLETPQTTPYPENLSYNTKEIIKLKTSSNSSFDFGAEGENWEDINEQ